jgi:hypothetical protein
VRADRGGHSPLHAPECANYMRHSGYRVATSL